MNEFGFLSGGKNSPRGSFYTPSEHITYTFPKLSGWACELFAMGNTIVVTPSEGNVPCWFWRTMQHLLLGNRWYRVDK